VKMTKLAVAAIAALFVCNVYAKVSDEEAKALGTTLTKFGADPKASSDGLVPAYSDASVTPPAGYKEGGGHYPDPFASEKPLYSITQKNMNEYLDKLTPGTQALLKRFPDFRIDVYPSHRTMRYPEYTLDASVKNATAASLSSSNLTLQNAWGGVPFPIPKTGAEVLWNHLLTYFWPQHDSWFSGYLVDGSGNITDIGDNKIYYYQPYFDPNAKASAWMLKYVAVNTGPPAQVGEKTMFWQPVSYDKNDQQAWSYTPGLRRVRLAPEFSYDTPCSNYGGAIVYDEILMFSGKMDRFDWKLVGKKEMIVPYNDYKMVFDTEAKDFLGKSFIDPKVVRWEVHRVWEVEGTLKPDARHIYAKRTFYMDEDTWGINASDSYDHAGKLYRVGFDYMVPHYGNHPDAGYGTFGFYDFSKGNYMIASHYGPKHYFIPLDKPRAENQWLTPDSMAGSGVR
jgi:hypothetical protein